MAVMMAKLYTALRSANVPEAEAQGAAEEIAAYENRFAKIESDLNLLKWMTGSVLALAFLILGKLFAH